VGVVGAENERHFVGLDDPLSSLSLRRQNRVAVRSSGVL